jgi:hypothetical protein
VEVLGWESRWAQCSERLVDGWGADAVTKKSTAIANAEAKDKRLQAALEECENALSSSDEGKERSNNSGGKELPLLRPRRFLVLLRADLGGEKKRRSAQRS